VNRRTDRPDVPLSRRKQQQKKKKGKKKSSLARSLCSFYDFPHMY